MDIINTMPDTIMIQIFGYLSPNMMKCCTFVCKRWNEIVGFSELMARFQLNLKIRNNMSKKDERIQEARGLKRKHRTASVILSQSSLDVICRHNLQTLKLEYGHNIKLSTFIKILDRFPALKVLAANLSDPTDDISSSDFKKTRVNLKELDCSVNIIHIFDCKSIKALKLSWFSPVIAAKKQIAIDFVKKQNNLEELTLYGNRWNEFFTLPDIFEFKFALKKLRLDSQFDEMKCSQHCALIGFLNRHKESLTSLELHFCTDPVFGIKLIHNFVLENLINLKHIEFGYFCVTDEGSDGESDDEFIMSAFLFPFDEMPHSARVAKSIESIAVILVENQIYYDRFFALFPNLKQLSFWTKIEDSTLHTSSMNSISLQLETLKLMNYSGETDELNENSYFPNLKEIIIGEYWETNLGKFLNRHSNTLEKITFKDCDDIKYDTTKSILNCTQLKYLDVCFESPSVCMMSMLNEISFRPRTFILKISYSSHKYSFIFPDDKTLWDEEIENLKKKIFDRCCAIQ